MSDRKKTIEHVDSDLIIYLNKQWFALTKEFRNKEKTDVEQRKILFSLANILREYINTVRPRRGGMITKEFRLPAWQKLVWLQKSVLSREYDSTTSKVLKACSYGKKYIGNLATEGAALRKPVSARDRAKFDALHRKASERFRKSAGESDDQDTDRLDVLRSLGVVDDPADISEDGSSGDLDSFRNGNTNGLS